MLLHFVLTKFSNNDAISDDMGSIGIIFEKFNASVILRAKYFVPVFSSVLTLHTRTSSRKIKMRNLFVPNLIPRSRLGEKMFWERREPLLSILSAQNPDF